MLCRQNRLKANWQSMTHSDENEERMEDRVNHWSVGLTVKGGNKEVRGW